VTNLNSQSWAYLNTAKETRKLGQMNKQARSRWGYVPIVVGLVMIAYGISLLYTHVVVNNELARPN
jgi:hypothetical protein